MLAGMHLARQNLAPTGALLFEKCARDFLSAPTDAYPKRKSPISSRYPILTTIVRVTSLQSDFIPCFAPDSFP